TRRYLLLIVVTGAALRVFAIWFGLAYPQARPDEAVAVDVAAKMLEGDPNPRFFHWPSLTFYLFAALFWLAGLDRPEGVFGTATHVLLARIVVALAGTATIAVLFTMARRI